MQHEKRWAIGGAAAVLAIAGGVTAVTVQSDDDGALSGETKDRVVVAALEETGGGTVLEAEKGDDGAAYEVEVRLADGSVTEVELDADFAVTGTVAGDDDGSGDDDSGSSEGGDD